MNRYGVLHEIPVERALDVAIAEAWCVMCRVCKREGEPRDTRAAALAAWADETRDLLDKIIHGRA